MKSLGSPAGLAMIALLLAAAVHPGWDLARLGTVGALAVPLLALLFALAIGLAARGAGAAGALVTAGVALALSGLAYDELRGLTGRLVLLPEQGVRLFEEEGPGGAALGLRPLGFELRLVRARPDGATLVIAGPARTAPVVLIGPRQAAAVAERGLRLGWLGYTDAPPQVSLGVYRQPAALAVAAGVALALVGLALGLRR